VPRLHAAAGAVYDGDVSTRSPGDPPEDTPDEAAGAADDRPASAAGQPHDAVFRQILGDVAHAALASEHGQRGLLIVMSYTERVNPHVDRDTLIRHLTPLVGPGLEQTMLTFEDILRNEALEKARRDVRDEVRREEREEGQRELLLRQLTRRFGSLPAVITSRVARASRDEIARWSDRILDATSLDDVFAAS
jgi:hypothetical protein